MMRQTSMQVSEAMKRQIEDLKALGYGPTTSAVIRLAVDRMHREHVAHVTAAGPHAGPGAQHKEGAKMFKPGQQVTLVTATFDSVVEPDKRYTHYSDYDGELTTNQGWSTVILTEAEAVALNLGRGFVRYRD